MTAREAQPTARLRNLAASFSRELGWNTDPAVRAVFVVGSVARGSADEVSDVDLVVLVDKVPAADARTQAYLAADCRDLAVNLFAGGAPAVSANIDAIDKARYAGQPFDVCYCRPATVHVYDYQPIHLLWAREAVRLPLAEVPRDRIPPGEVKERLRYNLRIARVHADRYARWTSRRAWMEIDLTIFLRVVRDALLVEAGIWRYNENQTGLWERSFTGSAAGRALRERIEAVRMLSDSAESARKLEIMSNVVSELEAMLGRLPAALPPAGGDQ